MKNKKTWKRELAVILLVWFMYIVEVKDVEVVKVLVFPVFSYITAVFLGHEYSKLQQSKPSEPLDR